MENSGTEVEFTVFMVPRKGASSRFGGGRGIAKCAWCAVT
jgi:hypothetical protein